MSLKIKRWFWRFVILCGIGFLCVLGLEMYIKSRITNIIHHYYNNSQVEFSGNISLLDISYNMYDLEIYNNDVKINVKSMKYKILSDNSINAKNLTIKHKSNVTMQADSFNLTQIKDDKKLVFSNLQVQIPNMDLIKITNPQWIMSDSGFMNVSCGILFDSYKMKMNLSRDSGNQPANIKFTSDSPYYTLSSDSIVNINNLTIPKTNLEALMMYNQIKFINFHLVNKNISGLHIPELNAQYIADNLLKIKLYDPKYQPAVTYALDNFFHKKQDIYGYFHTKNLLSFGSHRLSKPLLILSNQKLPTNENQLNNFRMPVNPPTNTDPEEQEPTGDKSTDPSLAIIANNVHI